MDELLGRIALARSKFHNFRTLRSLCINKVSDSLLTYADRGLKRLSSVLPDTLVEEVLKKFLEPNTSIAWYRRKKTSLAKEDHIKIAGLFIDPNLKFFDVRIFKDGLTSREEYHFMRTCVNDTECPGLQTLISLHNLDENRVLFSTDALNIDRLHNLRSLQMDYIRVVNTDLETIGRNLPHLQHLAIRIDDSVNTIGLQHLKNLKKLEKLVLDQCIDDEEYEIAVERLQFCLGLLPFLKHLGEDVNRHFTEEGSLTEHDLSMFSEKQIELQLETLVVGSDLQIPPGVSLPHIATVGLYQFYTGNPYVPFTRLADFTQFQKLTSVNAKGLQSQEVEELLEFVGNQLTSLCVQWLEGALDLTTTLNHCPKIVYFRLYCRILDNIDVAKIASCVKNIKVFHLDNLTHYSLFGGESTSVYSRGLLQMLLACCPVLEDLELNKCVKVPAKEYEDIVKDIKVGNIIISPHLTHINVRNIGGLDDRRYLIFCLHMFANLPDLKLFTVGGYGGNIGMRLNGLFRALKKFSDESCIHESKR